VANFNPAFGKDKKIKRGKSSRRPFLATTTTYGQQQID
jgi:hypothetical protein